MKCVEDLKERSWIFCCLLFVVYVVGFETDRKKEIRLLKKTFFITEWES